MLPYVVDASVIVQHLIADTYTSNADTLFGALGDTVQLYLPEFCLLECANVIWKEVRFHGLAEAEADLLSKNLTSLPVTVVPVSQFLQACFRNRVAISTCDL